jgi:ABC-type uncharacterized transport system substrate-binding protein
MWIKSYRRQLIKFVWVGLLLYFIFGPFQNAQAHPHFFIENYTRVILNKNGITGFKCYWRLDEMTSSSYKLTYDMNFDGKIEGMELARLKRVFFELYQPFNFFIHIRHKQKKYPPNTIEDFAVNILDDRFVFELFVPFVVKIDDLSKAVYFSVYDERFWVDIKLAENMLEIKNPHNIPLKFELYKNKAISFYILKFHPMELRLSLKNN